MLLLTALRFFFLFTYLFLLCSSLCCKLSSCFMAKFNKCLILMRWNMLLFFSLFICMPTCSLCAHCVIHSLSRLSTLDFFGMSEQAFVCMCVYVCVGIAVYFYIYFHLFIFNSSSLFQLMGQFKFGILIKCISFNLVHNICIIQTNYSLLCCEHSTLMKCIHFHSFIHLFVNTTSL